MRNHARIDLWRLVAALSTAMILALACRFSPGQSTPTATEPGFLPLTAVAQATAPPPARRPCPVPTDSPSRPDLSDPAQSAAGLQQFLAQGGDPRALAEANPDLDLARPDVDGDGWVDLAFVLRQPGQGGIVTPGTLLVFRCHEQSYRLLYTDPLQPELSAPTIHSQGDLNGDGQDELLLSRRSCGAHTCTAQLQLLLWRDGTLANALTGATDDLPSPEIEFRPGQEGEADRIAVTGTGINSVGAGPFRPLTRIWSWDPAAQQYQPSEEQLAPPQYRVHLLHDADRAARAGDFDQAAAAYRRVIEDEGLEEWVEPQRERVVLGSFARFRLIVVALQRGQPQAAREALDQLQSATPDAGPGLAYLELAETYWAEYERSGDPDSACQAARQYAAAHSPQILDPLYFGYANPTYSAEDMCSREQG